jgi:hypothetical protein
MWPILGPFLMVGFIAALFYDPPKTYRSLWWHKLDTQLGGPKLRDLRQYLHQ